MSTHRPKQSNCQAWNMQVMWLALPDGSATVRLPEGCRRMRLPRCGQTLRKARTLLSEPRTITIVMAGSVAWLAREGVRPPATAHAPSAKHLRQYSPCRADREN